jgi:hypothetical protein
MMSLNRPKPAGMSAVASLLATDRTTLTAALKPLRRRGLVKVAPDPADRRGRLMTLTAKGRTLLIRAVPVWRNTHVTELAGIIRPALRVARPPEEHVARGLQHTLPRHHAFAVIDITALSRVRLKHRGERIFELQQHRVVLTGHQQGHGATRSYAAHSHDFPRNRIADYWGCLAVLCKPSYGELT